MNNPKITIITASFNSIRTIEQTISSIVNQTYNNIEYIIIDGGSTDGTLDIIKKYEDKIAYFVSEPDKGIYDAFNKGVSVATGEYIEFIGSDDCLVSCNVISDVVKQIEADVDILSCTNYEVTDDGYQWIYYNKAKNRDSYIGGMISHPGMFTKRELLIQYPFDTNYRIAGDLKFFLTCFTNPAIRFKYIDLPVVFFATSGVSYRLKRETERESDRVYEELGWPYRVKDIQNNDTTLCKKSVKFILRKIRLFPIVNMFFKKHFSWEKHHCNNKICRWCGRM